MTLRELQKASATWDAHNFPKATPHQPLLGMCEEVGELCHAHLKAEQGIRGTPEEHFHAKCDALGDLFKFAAHYANSQGIDLEMAITQMWSEVSQRDWIKYPKNGKTE